MCGQGRLKTIGLAFEYAGHLREAEAQRAQGHDVAATLHCVGSVGPPPSRVASRSHKAALLIDA